MDKRLFQTTLIALACQMACRSARAVEEIQFQHARMRVEVSAQEAAKIRGLSRPCKSGEILAKETNDKAERQSLNRFPASKK